MSTPALPPLSTIVPSLIRTYVPLLVAYIASLLGSAGIILPEDASQGLVAGISAIVAGVYYLIVRLAEAKVPAIGLLLGSQKQPVYVDPNATAIEQSVSVAEDVNTVAKKAV